MTSGRLGAALLLFFLACALLADLAPYGPREMDLRQRFAPPSWRSAHVLGTDVLGRDLLSRLLHGTRISLAVGVGCVGVALLLGVPLGLLAGFRGGAWDRAVMGLVDLMLAFPSILLAVALVALLGNSLPNAMLAVGLVMVPGFARLTRSSVLVVKRLEYVQAAVAQGATPLRVALRHVLPNCTGPLVVQATLALGVAILDAAALSFLGLGARPPQPEWGTMLADSYRSVQQAPWLAVGPGLALLGLVLGFNLAGDALGEALDPRARARPLRGTRAVPTGFQGRGGVEPPTANRRRSIGGEDPAPP